MRILAVIVSYYPDVELLERNVASILSGVERIMIWENTPSPENLKYRLPDNGKVFYASEGENIGISKALNKARDLALNEGFDALLTMDQDSVWHGFEDFLSAVSSQDAPFGLYGPAVYASSFTEKFNKVDTLITSGMLVLREVFYRIGGYEEEFFVDGIDLDFCYKASEAGISSWVVAGSYLEQRFGGKRTVTFLGFRPEVYDYSPARLQGICYSQMVLLRKYSSNPYRKRDFLKHYFLKRIPRIILFEKDKCNKVRAIVSGTLQGLRWKPRKS